jgi:hypothetical protein
MNLTEGLRPWQPEKIYYFHNPSHDIFAGQGPHSICRAKSHPQGRSPMGCLPPRHICQTQNSRGRRNTARN